MTIRSAMAAVLLGVSLLGGCGDSGEPLRSGTLTADFKGQPFTPSFGYATLYKNAGLIALGDGPIHCGTETSPSPPTGTNAILSVPTLTVGTYSSVYVQLLQADSNHLTGVGSNAGTVTLTAVSADSVAGSVAFSYTDGQQQHYSISGTFDVLHCAP